MQIAQNAYQRESATEQRYKFNGKELQPELDLGWTDYGFRMYMADIGRWGVVDALTDFYIDTSPYGFVKSNPVNNIEVDGRYFDGKNEKKASKIQKKAEKQAAKLIKKAEKFEARGKDVGDLRDRASQLSQSAQDVET